MHPHDHSPGPEVSENRKGNVMAERKFIHLEKRIFMVFEMGDNPVPIGTGFNLNRPGFVLTAQHILEGQKEVFVVDTSKNPLGVYPVSDIVRHPSADLVILRLKNESLKDQEHFYLGVPESGFSEFPLGEDVASYGFPQVGMERPINPRFMQGHITRHFQYGDGEYSYSALELGFPAFHGQSGSPVFLNMRSRSRVIGMVTRSIFYTSECFKPKDKMGTEDGFEYEKEITGVSWAIGLSLTSLYDWVQLVLSEPY